jgi:hypothetical protein
MMPTNQGEINMQHWLFPDALVNKPAYIEAQGYWDAQWRSATAEVSRPWENDWMNNPMADGNPIFTARCRELGRGIRIIHEAPPEPGSIELDWWFDSFGHESEPEAIRELVIACCPSAENARRIHSLMTEWASGASEEAVERLDSFEEAKERRQVVAKEGKVISWPDEAHGYAANAKDNYPIFVEKSLVA